MKEETVASTTYHEWHLLVVMVFSLRCRNNGGRNGKVIKRRIVAKNVRSNNNSKQKMTAIKDPTTNEVCDPVVFMSAAEQGGWSNK